MKLPLFLYGNYNDTLKNTRELIKECKNKKEEEIEKKIKNLTIKLDNLDYRNVKQDDLIVLYDSYSTRKISNAFFPGCFSNMLLFEESIKTSKIVSWYKEIALTKPWILLSLISDLSTTQFLLDKLYSIKILDALVLFWNELINTGSIYLNNTEEIFAERFPAKIDSKDGQNFWYNNLCLKKILFSAGISLEEINNNSIYLNFPVFWKESKKMLINMNL